MEELQTIDQSGRNVSESQIPVNPWVAIIQQSVEKGSDIVTIEKFIHLQREEEDRQAERAFNVSFSRLQGGMPEISKTGRASFKTKNGGTMAYNFDQLSDICNAIRPLLMDTGLSYSWEQKQEQGMITVKCTLRHGTGSSISNQMSSAPDTSGNKNNIQQIASTISYLQRYTLKALLGISSSDDDGAASTKLANDKINSDVFVGWKAAFTETIESQSSLEALTKFKTDSVNYAAKHDPSFCTEIYKKFEEIKQAKGW